MMHAARVAKGLTMRRTICSHLHAYSSRFCIGKSTRGFPLKMVRDETVAEAITQLQAEIL